MSFTETKNEDGNTVLKFSTDEEVSAFIKGMCWNNDDWVALTSHSTPGDIKVTVYREEK